MSINLKTTKKKNKQLSFGQYLVDTLKKLNCRYIYGYQGGSITDFINIIERNSGIEYISCRSELNASLAALSEAKMNINKENTVSCCVT